MSLPELDRGNHADIAELLIERCKKGDYSGDSYPIVYDQGSFWRWGGSVWEQVRHADLMRDFFRINSWAVSIDRKLFRISKPECASIISVAEVLCDEPGFFRESKSEFGMAFRNAWIGVSKDGLEKKDNTPERRARFLHDTVIRGDEECPRWLEFLDEVFDPDDDKDEKIEFVAQFLGACLTGQAFVYDRAVMLLGHGANGKSVFCDIVDGLFPDGSVSSVPPQDMSRIERCVPLATSMLNLVADIPTRDLRDVGSFKQIVSGDPIEARRLYQNSFRFRPTCGHLFSANALPATNDYSNGFFRRWVVLEFNRDFSGPSNVPRNELVERILAEKAGILLWAMKGAVRLMSRRSYFIPKSNKAIERSWRSDNDQVLNFVDECVERVFDPGSAVDDGGDALAGVAGSVLYLRYVRWARENGIGQLSNVKLARRLKDMGIPKRRVSKGVEWGVKLRDDNMWSEGVSRADMDEIAGCD